MPTKVTAPPATGVVVHPGDHASIHSLAKALDQLVKDLAAAPDRLIADGELIDGMSVRSPWITVPARRVAA